MVNVAQSLDRTRSVLLHRAPRQNWGRQPSRPVVNDGDYARPMVMRYQVVESLLWQPPARADADTVQFHVQGWDVEGRRPDFDDIRRRSDVIVQWEERDIDLGG